MLRKLLALSVLALAARTAAAGVTYDATDKYIWVRSFPEDTPATMDDVLEADRKAGWGLVSYDKATDTYTVSSSLHIGTDEDAGTYFQIGRKGHPQETVVVKGTLVAPSAGS